MAAAAMMAAVAAIVVLTLAASNGNAASLSRSNFGNETDAGAPSTWCDRRTEECLVGDDDVDGSDFLSLAFVDVSRISGRTGNENRPVCDRPGRASCLYPNPRTYTGEHPGTYNRIRP